MRPYAAVTEPYTGRHECHKYCIKSIRRKIDTKHYKITNLGEEALLYFENRLSNSIKQEILDYFKAEKINLKNESEIYADYYYNENQEYTVECVIKERRDTLIDLKLNVTSKTLARSICDNWRAKSTDVYQYLINELWVNSDNENSEPTTTDILKSKTPPEEHQ